MIAENLQPTIPDKERLIFASLPSVCQREVQSWLDNLAPLFTAQHGEGKELVDAIATVMGCSAPTVHRKKKALAEKGWQGLIDRSKYPEPEKNGGTAIPIPMQEELKRRHENCKRNDVGQSVIKGVQDQWRLWHRTGDPRHALPGYEFPPEPEPSTGLPKGFSARNLRNFLSQKHEKTLFLQGRARFRGDNLPSVLSTRVGLPFFALLEFDDHDEDLFVNWLGPKKQPTRPMGFHALERLSGCNFERFWVPTLADWEKDGVTAGGKQRHMEWLLIHIFLRYGWRSDEVGTTLVLEHGTANISKDFALALNKRSNGQINIRRSGKDVKPLFSGMLYGNTQGRGNFKIKASLEGWFHIYRILMSNLTGQTGNSVDNRPTELNRLLREEAKRLKLLDELPPERAAQLQFELMPYAKFLNVATQRIEQINRRNDHDLEGWEKCGFVTNEYRLHSGTTEWQALPSPKQLKLMPPAAAQAILALATDPIHGRPVKMSPRQVFERELAEAPMRTISPFEIHNLLPHKTHARPKTVRKDRLIQIVDHEIDTDPIHYEAFGIRTPDNRQIQLAPGTEVDLYVNPFDPAAALVVAKDGSCIGLAQMRNKHCASDDQAALHTWGRNLALESDLTRSAVERHRDIAASRTAMKKHNDAVITGAPITDEEKSQSRKDSLRRTRLSKPSTEIDPEETFATLSQRETRDTWGDDEPESPSLADL